MVYVDKIVSSDGKPKKVAKAEQPETAVSADADAKKGKKSKE